jgi:hypothetical protein
MPRRKLQDDLEDEVTTVGAHDDLGPLDELYDDEDEEFLYDLLDDPEDDEEYEYGIEPEDDEELYDEEE